MELLQDTTPSYRGTRKEYRAGEGSYFSEEEKKNLYLCLDCKNLPFSYSFAP